jgi:hypothetical protein
VAHLLTSARLRKAAVVSPAVATINLQDTCVFAASQCFGDDWAQQRIMPVRQMPQIAAIVY